MSEKKTPSLIGFIVIGSGVTVVGLATENYGLMGAGVVFIIIGVADVMRSRGNRFRVLRARCAVARGLGTRRAA